MTAFAADATVSNDNVVESIRSVGGATGAHNDRIWSDDPFAGPIDQPAPGLLFIRRASLSDDVAPAMKTHTFDVDRSVIDGRRMYDGVTPPTSACSVRERLTPPAGLGSPRLSVEKKSNPRECSPVSRVVDNRWIAEKARSYTQIALKK